MIIPSAKPGFVDSLAVGLAADKPEESEAQAESLPTGENSAIDRSLQKPKINYIPGHPDGVCRKKSRRQRRWCSLYIFDRKGFASKRRLKKRATTRGTAIRVQRSNATGVEAAR